MKPLLFLALLFSAAALSAAPKTFYFDDIAFHFAHKDENPATRIYAYVPQGQKLENTTTLFTIIVVKSPVAVPDAWFQDVAGSIEDKPLTTLLHRDDENRMLAFAVVNPDSMEYHYWRYGVDVTGQTVANGIAWHFTDPEGRKNYADFLEKKANKYYDLLKTQPLMSFTADEK